MVNVYLTLQKTAKVFFNICIILSLELVDCLFLCEFVLHISL